MQPVYSFGHSNRTIEEYLATLSAYPVRLIADVRKMPRSRRHPHFNSNALAASLNQAGIGYVHLPGLGGLRQARPDSVNTGFRPDSGFRGYADYMQTPEFEETLQKLLALSQKQPTAMMCAEGLPSNCHRSLISDALVARGVEVLHILADGIQPHALTSWARMEAGQLVYPSRDRQMALKL